MNIGLYFGSFNPIHNGHLKLAAYIAENQALDEVWFVVSPRNPLKKLYELLDENLRYEMVELAIAHNAKLKACDVEFSLPKPSYTIDTLNFLKEKFPENHFTLLIGSDNALTFDQWKNFTEILNNYKILVYPRRGYDFAAVAAKYPQMQLLQTPIYEISSTEIRKKISENKKIFIKKWLQDNIIQYISKKNLYK